MMYTTGRAYQVKLDNKTDDMSIAAVKMILLSRSSKPSNQLKVDLFAHQHLICWWIE